MKRRIGWVVAIALIWVLLWDNLTLANLAAGVVVGILVLIAFPLPAVERPVEPHLVGVIRLVSAVSIDLIRSNMHFSWLILNPRATFTGGVVECQMSTNSPPLLSTIANIIALSPGMMAVEAAHDPNTLLVHALRLTPDEVRQRVARLERLVTAALGTAADRAAVGR